MSTRKKRGSRTAGQKRKPLRGAARMQQLGRIATQTWFTAEQMATIRRAAGIDNRSVASFVLNSALSNALNLINLYGDEAS